ncbi:MAG: sulfotransferase [Sphingobium sp.]
MLRSRDIIAEAEGCAGIRDPETHLHGGLHALVASLNGDNRLSAAGEAAAQQALVARTVDRLEAIKWVNQHPEIEEEKIEAPVFLTGLPRSGASYFQYLFDRDPRYRLLRPWEMSMLSSRPGAKPATPPPRGVQERQMRPEEVEGFDALHLIDSDGSEDCHAFLEQSYAAAGFFNVGDAPSYIDYLLNRMDMTGPYRVHRRQLQLLQWRTAPRRWVVKYPNHVIAMDAILDVYPDARFAMTHRDPLQTLAAVALSTLTLRSARYDPPLDPHRVGKQMMDFMRRHVDRIMAFCTGPHADRVVHVDYYALVADPVTRLEAVHGALGTDLPGDVREAIGGWRRDDPKGRRGSGHNILEQFGIDVEAAAELFSDYRRHFDIPREKEALLRMGAAA